MFQSRDKMEDTDVSIWLSSSRSVINYYT
jgi:hypothetical protein